MSNWHDMLLEIMKLGSQFDILRRKYLAEMHQITGRNIVCYYSGWLQKQGFDNELIINDLDKNGFMTVFNGLNPDLGLDLILHTPGGDTAATESIVDYIHKKFGNNVRCIVPQLSMSAGTMIACSAKEIGMGKHSSLGPIDPQFNGIPAHGILEEFDRACIEVTANPNLIPIWQPIVAKYNPALLGECQKVIAMSNSMVSGWLTRNMFHNDPNAPQIIQNIINELGNHSVNLAHNRHLSSDKCKSIGLKIFDLEADQKFQECVLSVHHAFMHTLASTAAIKIIENHNGIAYINQTQMVMMQKSPPAKSSSIPEPI